MYSDFNPIWMKAFAFLLWLPFHHKKHLQYLYHQFKSHVTPACLEKEDFRFCHKTLSILIGELVQNPIYLQQLTICRYNGGILLTPSCYTMTHDCDYTGIITWMLSSPSKFMNLMLHVLWRMKANPHMYYHQTYLTMSTSFGDTEYHISYLIRHYRWSDSPYN